jgi:hypothetical protein
VLNQSGDTAEQIADADLGLFSNLQTVCYWCGAVRSRILAPLAPSAAASAFMAASTSMTSSFTASQALAD